MTATLIACGGASVANETTEGEDPGWTSAPIVDGTEDAGDDAVGGIVGLAVPPKPYCSGTLIAPRVVLTAAHCLAGREPHAVIFGRTPIAVTATKQHPGFDLLSLAHDVAILNLETDAPAKPAPIAPAPSVGERVRVAGWGTTSPDSSNHPEGGPQKRSGFQRVERVSNTDFEGRPNPSSPCSGDSGGAVFDERDGLVGVISSGDAHCSTYALATRVDVHSDFITEAIAPSSESGCSIGERSNTGPRPWLSIFMSMLALAAPFLRAARRKR